MLEKPHLKPPALKTIINSSKINIVSNSIVAFLFMHTGPIAILLSAAQTGGLHEREMTSWLFAGYGLGGLLTILLSLLYKQPLAIAWSLPAAAIVGASLEHLVFSQVVGAYIITGILITVISITGAAKKIVDLIPLPIIMGMVAGVFLPFCMELVTTFTVDPWLASITIISFFLISSSRTTARLIPPIFASVLAGIILIVFRQEFNIGALEFSAISPMIYTPEFNLKAILDLVLPLTISVIGIHNMQGIGILQREGYNPPINTMTLTCGLGTVGMGLLGSVPACITGPTSAILNSSGKTQHRYAGSFYLGCLMILSAIFAPVAIGLALEMPSSLVALIGGLALLRVLQDAFHTAFKDKFTLGALGSFVITASNITFLNIGSAFWGLVIGCLLSLLIETQDFKEYYQKA